MVHIQKYVENQGTTEEKEGYGQMKLFDFHENETTKRQRNHAPAALLRLGALAQRLTMAGDDTEIEGILKIINPLFSDLKTNPCPKSTVSISSYDICAPLL